MAQCTLLKCSDYGRRSWLVYSSKNLGSIFCAQLQWPCWQTRRPNHRQEPRLDVPRNIPDLSPSQDTLSAQALLGQRRYLEISVHERCH